MKSNALGGAGGGVAAGPLDRSQSPRFCITSGLPYPAIRRFFFSRLPDKKGRRTTDRRLGLLRFAL